MQKIEETVEHQLDDRDLPNVYVGAFSTALGETLVTNEDLERENPSWIMSRTIERTGIGARTIANTETTALDLAEQAAHQLIKRYTLDTDTIDGLIFCTQTPDQPLPSNASLLHGRLGLSHNVLAIDLSHACSGYVYALGVAKSFVRSGAARRVLVVTGDTYSRLIHPEDRSVRAIFGDGAACCLVSNTPSLGLLVEDVQFWTDGSKSNRFQIANGGARTPFDPEIQVSPDRNARVKSPNHIQMDGLGLLSFFNSVLPRDIRKVLSRNDQKLENVDHFVFHQASKMAIDGIVRALKIPEDKVVREFSETGNLVSSSIPVALARLSDQGRIKAGDTIILCGFGVGLSWSIALLKEI